MEKIISMLQNSLAQSSQQADAINRQIQTLEATIEQLRQDLGLSLDTAYDIQVAINTLSNAHREIKGKKKSK